MDSEIWKFNSYYNKLNKDMITKCRSRFLLLIWISIFSGRLCAQENEETIVRSFVETLSTWCKTGNDKNREKLGQLTNENVGTSVKSGYGCRVNNKFMKLLYDFVKTKHPNSSIDIGKGSIEVSTYLNYLTWAIMDDMSYKHGLPVWLKDFKEPVAYEDKSEEPLYVFDVDESVNGSVEFNGRNQYWVRGNQITYILDHDDPMARAVEFYSNREYEKAFELFRELAYSNPNNYEAQYYTAVMEIKRQGCDNIDSKIRDIEAAWWITRGLVASTYSYAWYKERMKKLYVVFSINENKLPYNTHTKNLYLRYLMSAKLVSEGMMPIKKWKGKFWRYGFMNEKGKIVVPCKYSFVEPFNSNGLAAVALNNRFGFIDKHGKEVIPVKYNSVLSQFKNGRTYVILDGDLLLINEHGDIIKEVGKGFEVILSNIVKGLVFAKNKNSGKYYLYDMDGELSSVENDPYGLDYTINSYYLQNKEGKRIYVEPFDW